MRGRVGKILLWIAGALIAGPAFADGLKRIDMAILPLADIHLQGGSFIASVLEDDRPWKSQILAECRDCARPTDALVGLQQDTQTEARDFLRDPETFLKEIEAVCVAQAEVCVLGRSTVGGLPGYAYTARFADGTHIVEHVYYANGLVFLINASGPDPSVAKANVAALIRVAGPYVTGQKP